MKLTTKEHRSQIHKRIRKKIHGTAARPRLSVFRSNVGIYCQVIDDVTGHTLCAASHKEVEATGNKSDISKAVGNIKNKNKKIGPLSMVNFLSVETNNILLFPTLRFSFIASFLNTLAIEEAITLTGNLIIL